LTLAQSTKFNFQLNTSPSHIPQPPYYEEDEITLKELILTIQSYAQEIFKNISWIILAILLTCGSVYYFTKSEPVTYTSNISFLIQEDKNEIGVPDNPIIVRRGKSAAPNKIEQLAFSSSVINRVLLEPVSIGNKKDFFANYIIDIYEFHAKWNNEKLEEGYEQLRLQDFYFINDNINNFNVKEYRALQILRDFVKKMFSVNAEGYADFNKITVTSVDDKVSFKLRDLLFSTLKDLYIENTVGRVQRNYELLTLKVDSLENKFRLAERQLATATDQTYGLISKSSYLRKSQIEEEAARLNKMYQTFLDQQQEVDFKLNSNTPDFLIVDQTFLPIKNKQDNRLNNSLISVFLVGFLSIGFVIGRKIIRDAMS